MRQPCKQDGIGSRPLSQPEDGTSMKRGEREPAALAVALPVFTVLWHENRGDFSFADQTLLSGPGSIHAADYDGDGQPDVGAGSPPAAGSAS
jgi:hypothetical protein